MSESKNRDEIGRAIDLIWNTTLICPYDCAICCVDAVHVQKTGQKAIVRSEGLQRIEELRLRSGASIYDQVAESRQQAGLELTLEEKIGVLDNLEGFEPKIDFSGGDPLCISETIDVMREASRRFGRDRITLTATGAGLQRHSVEMVAPLISELNFTFDGQPDDGDPNRPSEYAAGNLRRARVYAEAGVSTRAELPLTLQNCDEQQLRRIYRHLCEAGIDKLLAMRLFPVGRGANRSQQVPSPDQYGNALKVLRGLEREFQTPALRIQCALGGLGAAAGGPNPCDALTESFGLMSDGTLLGSPWAVGATGKPLDASWVLGNLANEPLEDLLSSARFKQLYARAGENAPHCKIFAWLHGDERIDGAGRMFARADPIYAHR